MLLAMILVSAQMSLFALSAFGTPPNKAKVYIINMYGENVSLECVWRADSTLGGFDRTKEKILKTHHTSYQELKAPYSRYHLYKIDVAPEKNITSPGSMHMNESMYTDNQFDNYVSRYSNNDILQVERSDRYFVIEKSNNASQIPGQNQIAIREFASQKESDAYLKKMPIQKKAQEHIQQAQQHLNALSPQFIQHYYGDSLRNEEATAGMIQDRQAQLNNDIYNMRYAANAASED